MIEEEKISYKFIRGTFSVIDVVIGNGISNLSSNPGYGCLFVLMPLRKV